MTNASKDHEAEDGNPLVSQFKDWLSYLPPHLRERTRLLSSSRMAGRSSRVARGIGSTISERTPVVYWTHHALRVDENPALDVGCTLAFALNRPLLVYQSLSSNYRYASDRHHVFQLQAVLDLHRAYSDLGIRYAFHLQTREDSSPTLLRLAQQTDLLITDDFPGEPTDRWMKRLSYLENLKILAVDTACVVPMQLVGKSYDRAFGFRDATKKLYEERIDRAWPKPASIPKYFDGLIPFEPVNCPKLDPYAIVSLCEIDSTIPPVADTPGGSKAGYDRWSDFLKHRIHRYASKRNDPCADVSSRMSAYLHYGMVSPMRLAREASEFKADKYLDELLIWRELAYGYCFYRKDFQTIQTLPPWAIDTLRKHATDARSMVYSWETLARAQSNDSLWNTCQQSLIRHGELHNNVRMTWGKALLGWTRSPEKALAMLIDLNHRFALDGRDPASYGGILWCLGQFDRPFYPESPVLGTVRPRPTQDHLKRLDLKKYQAIVQRPIASRARRVAVIGAGLSGAFCARTLSDMGCQVEVFEKSRGAGGRAATRRLASSNTIDHGAPFLEMPSDAWQHLFDSWQQDGVIDRWQPRLGNWSLDSGNVAISDVAVSTRGLWVGRDGMNRLGKHLVQGLSVRYQATIEDLRSTPEGWWVRGVQSRDDGVADKVEFGPFDCVVLAMPAPQTAQIVPSDCIWKSLASQRRMEPVWAMLIEFERSWELGYDAIQFLNHPALAWISRQASKPSSFGQKDRNGSPEAWVVHANSPWSECHLESPGQQVASLLLEALEGLGLGEIPRACSSQVHRWRYAQASPTHEHQSGLPVSLQPYYWDPDRGLGACGDWIAPLSSCALKGRSSGGAQALSSGAAMAGAILRQWIAQFPVGIASVSQKQAFQPRLFSDEAF